MLVPERRKKYAIKRVNTRGGGLRYLGGRRVSLDLRIFPTIGDLRR